MSRIIGMEISPLTISLRARIVPIASTMLASMLTLVPVVATAPVMPPTGLLMLLGWRLLRPEIWPVWAALPLGLWDDLFSGQPIGSAMLTWTICFIAIDQADRWLVWRDYGQDWAIAAGAITFCLAVGFLIALFTGGGGYIQIIVPQILASILFFPVFARGCAMLDHWRLMR
jgi:rod shape-determining protein MreD